MLFGMWVEEGVCLPGKKRAVRDRRGCLAEAVDAHLLDCGRRSGYALLGRMAEQLKVERQNMVLKAVAARLCGVMSCVMMSMIVTGDVAKAPPWQT